MSVHLVLGKKGGVWALSAVYRGEDIRLLCLQTIKGKYSKKCTFYTLRFGCSFAAVNTIKPQLL